MKPNLNKIITSQGEGVNEKIIITLMLPDDVIRLGGNRPPKSSETWGKGYKYYQTDGNDFKKYGSGMPNCTCYAFGRLWEISDLIDPSGEYGEGLKWQKPLGIFQPSGDGWAGDWFFEAEIYKRSPLFNPSSYRWKSNDLRQTWKNKMLPMTDDIFKCIPMPGAVAAYLANNESRIDWGHVMIVEKVDIIINKISGQVEDYVIYCSQSGWQKDATEDSSLFFYTSILKASNFYRYSQYRDFIGFIYHPYFNDIENAFLEEVKKYQCQLQENTEIVNSSLAYCAEIDISKIRIPEFTTNALFSFGYFAGVREIGEEQSIMPYEILSKNENQKFYLSIKFKSGEKEMHIMRQDITNFLDCQVKNFKQEFKIFKENNILYITEFLNEKNYISINLSNSDEVLKIIFELEYFIEDANREGSNSTSPDKELYFEHKEIVFSLISPSFLVQDFYYDAKNEFLSNILSSEREDVSQQGVFLNNGQLYINASMIATGTIMSQNWISSGGKIGRYGGIEFGGSEGTAIDLTTGEINTNHLVVKGQNNYMLGIDSVQGLTLHSPNSGPMMSVNNDSFFFQSDEYREQKISSTEKEEAIEYYWKKGFLSGVNSGLNIRKTPSASAESIGTILPYNYGELRIECDSEGVLKKENNFYVLKDYNNTKTSYVYSNYIFTDDGDPQEQTSNSISANNYYGSRLDIENGYLHIAPKGGNNNRVEIGGNDTYALQIGKFKVKWDGTVVEDI